MNLDDFLGWVCAASTISTAYLGYEAAIIMGFFVSAKLCWVHADIQRLKYCQRSKSMSEWISVDKRLPPKGSGPVLWYQPAVKEGRRADLALSERFTVERGRPHRKATHWMALNPPEEQEHE